MKIPLPGIRFAILIPILPLITSSVFAGVRPPYVSDSNTVYLYHLDEAALSTSAANTGTAGFAAIPFDGTTSTNNATTAQATLNTILGANAYSGYGKSANISAAGYGLGVDANASGGFQMGLNAAASPDALLQSSLAAADGSFTMEAMVNLPAITGTGINREIFCTDNSLANNLRGFQFRVNTTGQLEFNFIGTNTTTTVFNIPTTGIHAFAANEWFHVALAYDGPTHTSNFYWTRVSASPVQANLIGSSTVETTLGTISSPLVIGNEARSAGSGLNSTEGLRGLIDEVRISKVVRAATDFMFYNGDTDADGLDDNWEITYFGNITAQDGTGDPDADGFTNLHEYTAGSLPNNITSTPNDLDADGLADLWEVTYFGNIAAQNGTGDPDADFATNAEEQAASTSPKDTFAFPDTDGDLMSDGWERFYFSNLSQLDSSDPDNDGFSNYNEFLARTSPVDGAWTPEKAKLAHRWNFNNNLDDSVGTSNAQLLDPDANNALGGVSTLSSTDVLLAGGAQGTSDYVSLGSNLLTGIKTPITIELWATQVAVQNWSRIFDFGNGQQEYLMMSWTQAANIASDRVEWNDTAADTIVNDTVQPYTLGVEQHIVMTIQPGLGTNGTTLVTWYAAPVSTSLGAAQGSFSTANDLVSLNDSLMWLGRSQFTGDNTANARYNEFRIWTGALTSTEREAYHAVGADVLNLADTDNDGLPDAWEISNFGNITAQNGSGDPDEDLFTNTEEFTANTNPNVQFSSPDTDFDGLPDGWEVHWFRSNVSEDLATVLAKYLGTDDVDSDGFKNTAEYAANTSPVDPASNPLDVDADGLVDTWEINYFTNLAQSASADPDGDGASNLQEQAAGSNPTLLASTPADADGDSIVDTAESFHPYTADADTLHLWHLDEVKAPASDAGSNALSLTSLENSALLWSPSLASFKTGLDTSAGRGSAASGVLAALPLAADTTDDTTLTYAGADGAFTFEAVVKIGFDPAAPPNPAVFMQIVSGDSEVGANRVWQFRIVPTAGAPVLQFLNINGEVAVQTIAANIPVGTAANAIAQNGWYHVAVTYNGAENTADNLKLYWTALDPANTQASEIGSFNMAADLITATPDFTIGNEGRANGGTTDNFAGVIDEVRISAVARAANGFLFTVPSSDADNDGLTDTWEMTYFGNLSQTATGDFDGDGTSNLTEFRLGLIPNSGTSFFSAARAAGGALTWPSVAGVTFTVQRSLDLSAAGWTTIATVPGTAGTATFTDPSPPVGKAFYKISLEP